MQYFPIFMNLREQPVLIIGAGSVAERKARLLIKAGAKVCIVAREMNAAFIRWEQAGEICLLAKEYQPELLSGARLVFAATADRELNSRVFADAELATIPVNVVDDRELCRFISPAVVDRSPIQVAISTGGAAPILARRLRSWVEAMLPLGLGRVAEQAGRLRRRASAKLTPAGRRLAWDSILSTERIRALSLLPASEVRRQLAQGIDLAAAAQNLPREFRGQVYLVGAGPGRADLLTLRALHVLGQADVILHDGLVSEEVMDFARRDADRIDVSKRAGQPHLDQQEINRLIVDEARKGRTVVRLKGGDSFVFGRGGEELEFLRENGISYEVVPGITAALGCAAYAGIPLTHREHAQALTFVTGHFSNAGKKQKTGLSKDVDWAGIAGPGKTTVVYMGVGQAANIRDSLLNAGISADLSVALVINGSLESQRVLEGRVETLPSLAAQAGTGSPGLLIIGQVAALGSNLAWFRNEALLKSAA